MATQAYTTREKVERRAGALGVDLRSDDDPQAVDDAIDEASTEVEARLLLLYAAAALAGSAWVELKCRDLAVFFLCIRRLNKAPRSAKERADKALEELDQVMRGERQIADAAQRKTMVPVLTNHRVKLRPYPHSVASPSRSTGTPAGYPQRVDNQDLIEPEP